MKKNLLTLMFIIAFICVGVSVASAKNSSSLGNSVAVSKRLSPAKIKALEAKCGPLMACDYELQELLFNNMLYENQCAAGGYQVGCAPIATLILLQSAADWEDCMIRSGGFNSKNIDKNMDRNKRQRSNVSE